MQRKNPSVSSARNAAVVIVWNGRHHAFPLDRWTLLGLAIFLSVFATALLSAMAYFVFHDQLLAAMVTRQVEMQYSYEDRIAVLSTQLDQRTIGDNAERGAIEMHLRRLDEKRAQLEGRTAAIDGLAARLSAATGKRSTPLPADPTAPFPVETGGHEPPFDSSHGLRLGHDVHAQDLHVDMSSGQAAARVRNLDRSMDLLEHHQIALLAGLAGPTMRSVERMTVALAKTGLPIARWHLDHDVGGPFVPLSATVGFDETLLLVQDAVRQGARLDAVIDALPLRRPLAGSLEVTSTFGARLDPFLGRPAMHTGVDLREAWGETVTATGAGIVTLAGSDGGYGNMVEIDHGNGVRTRYAHLGAIAVGLDQKVEVGTTVGQVGSTGRATGPHLHYEVRIDGEPVDPTRFLTAGADLFPG